jgi:hypothetical protein
MQYTIRRIHIWSVIKIAFFILAISGFLVGLLWGIFLWAFSSVLEAIMPAEFGTPEMSGLMVFILAFVLAPIYGVFGAVTAGIATAIYNAISKLTGGIEIQLTPKRPEPPIEPKMQEETEEGYVDEEAY